MSEEIYQSYTPEQVMVVTSPHFQSTISNTDNSFITNPELQDFTIYSQETTSEILKNGFYPNIHHVGPQAFVVDDCTIVDSTFNSPLDRHIESSPILESSGYTQLNQSILIRTSPHGNSINSPSLNLHSNNVFTPHSSPYTINTPLIEDNTYTVNTPLIENNILLNSPISYNIGVSQQQLFNETIGTPVFSELGSQVRVTPVPTPYWDDPSCSSFSSLNTTPYLAPQTPDTPLIDHRVSLKDSVLFDFNDFNSKQIEFFSLFPTHNNPVSFCNMASITPDEKKPDISSEAAVVPGTPSSGSISTSEKSPSLAVPEHISEIEPRPSNIDSIDVNNNSGSKSPNHSSDSAHTTPANTPRLVPIRPRESGEHSEQVRRSKRQRRKNSICKLIELLTILIVLNLSLVNIPIVVQDSLENMT
ncbi:5970_t:CDS:2 [Cetraspora pellucida]|uniref:5970_t:CDS:1 n=1 Tax=Cetraspora pellucida TaxID=1433469 RepID=A0ACA9MTU6_9GLOM|nr:5970_t:CDS:2 [Cetraspora pellucida]